MNRRKCTKLLKKITIALLLLWIVKVSTELLWLANDPTVIFTIDNDFPGTQSMRNRSNAEIFIRDEKLSQSNVLLNRKVNYNLTKIPVVIVLCQKELNSSKNVSTEEDALEKSKFFRQAKVLLKSITIVTKKLTRVIIVANKITPIQGVKKFISTWPIACQRKLLVEYHTFTPRKECMDKNLFKLCASVRLFLHEILPHEDSIIYVDSDFIFLESPEKLSNVFLNFNPSQFVGATHNGGFYEFPKYFHNADYYNYGNTGISSGLLLLNLTRIRKFQRGWTKTVYSVCRSYKRRLVLFDQGVYNIIFSEFAENLYELDCSWSFNLYFCHERSLCIEALEHGTIFGVHGPSSTFFLPLSKKFKVLFRVFERFNLEDSVSKLISNLKFEFREIERIQPEDTDGCQNFTGLENSFLQPLIHIEKI